MMKNKKKIIERILYNSKATDPAKESFMRAYMAAHKHIRRGVKSCGGA